MLIASTSTTNLRCSVERTSDMLRCEWSGAALVNSSVYVSITGRLTSRPPNSQQSTRPPAATPRTQLCRSPLQLLDLPVEYISSLFPRTTTCPPALAAVDLSVHLLLIFAHLFSSASHLRSSSTSTTDGNATQRNR